MKEGRAAKWQKLKIREIQEAQPFSPPWESNWQLFLQEFNTAFKDPDLAANARHQLSLLKQGSQPATEYVQAFKLLMVDTGYNDAALVEIFKSGLCQGTA
jgi:hypothetical protein